MKIIRLFLGFIFLAAVYFFLVPAKCRSALYSITGGQPQQPDALLHTKAAELYKYARKNGCNATIGFLIDMNRESGRNRFFVYDFQKDSILFAGLVTHGRCNERWLNGRRYANDVGCGCSSLGRYKVGHRYQGKFGQAYKLKGLDSTNSNAFRRFVVLHSHECVPEEEIFPEPICQSDGCPTVSPQMIVRLGHIIDTVTKPVLLCIFDGR